MGIVEAKDRQEALPLLQQSPKGTASSVQTFGNIIVSIVGTGVLGLPFAFKIAGWLAGSIGVILAGIANYYCMLLLIECRDRLKTEKSVEIQTYGDLGERAFGRYGRYATELLVLIGQCGALVAYLIFIGQNLSSVFKSHCFTFSTFIFLLVPVEIALSWIRSISAMAPVSAFADLCNVMAMAIVVREDLQLFDDLSDREAVTSLAGMPFAAGVAVFCFEGFTITLALEQSMKESRRFRCVLLLAIVTVTLIYACFGLFGYLAYGDKTKDIVTLNLPNDWSSIAVKIGLCIGLALTFPIMMHPINEILEAKLKESVWFHKACWESRRVERLCLQAVRAITIVVLAVLASFVPAFGAFVSLVGSTFCALLSFVLPATFHLIFVSASFHQRALNYFILMLGVVFACYGTYNVASGRTKAG